MDGHGVDASLRAMGSANPELGGFRAYLGCPVRTGTTNRIPSTADLSSTPQSWANGMWACPVMSIAWAVA